MKILQLFSQNQINVNNVWEEIIDENDKFAVSILYLPKDTNTLNAGNAQQVQSFYVINGVVEVQLNRTNGAKIDLKTFKFGTGWTLLPNQSQTLKTYVETVLFMVKGDVSEKKLEDRSGRNPITAEKINELSDYLVTKPWGSEQWLIENGVYVLKGITMNTGEQCSLQVHEFKQEVNLVLRGSVDVSLLYDEDIKTEIETHRTTGKKQAEFSIAEEHVTDIRNNMQVTSVGKNEGWRCRPFEIHQVLSKDTYFALEVSSPEVDDIVRLKDLYNRPGGRIESEHKQNK